jgi:hypothetical protein
MTDRHAGYLVTLASDLREDDAEATMNALFQIKGVIDVRPVVANPVAMTAWIRRDALWSERLIALVGEVRDA